MNLFDTYKTLLEHFGTQNWWPGETVYEIVIGAVLTQNTNWSNVEKAIHNLKENDLLNPSKILNIEKKRLAQHIRASGYYNQKAERLKEITEWYIKHVAKACKKRIPTSVMREELLKIKGIGPETADSILLYAFNRPVFVIDTYTKRMCRNHGIDFETYDKYQRYFEDNLPRLDYKNRVKLYNEFHALIVRLGKTYCKKKKRCERCPLKKYLSNCIEHQRA